MKRNQNRIEITLSDERLAALDEARGNEPRASFIKRWTDKGIAVTAMGGEQGGIVAYEVQQLPTSVPSPLPHASPDPNRESAREGRMASPF